MLQPVQNLKIILTVYFIYMSSTLISFEGGCCEYHGGDKEEQGLAISEVLFFYTTHNGIY